MVAMLWDEESDRCYLCNETTPQLYQACFDYTAEDMHSSYLLQRGNMLQIAILTSHISQLKSSWNMILPAVFKYTLHF